MGVVPSLSSLAYSVCVSDSPDDNLDFPLDTFLITPLTPQPQCISSLTHGVLQRNLGSGRVMLGICFSVYHPIMLFVTVTCSFLSVYHTCTCCHHYLCHTMFHVLSTMSLCHLVMSHVPLCQFLSHIVTITCFML